MTKKEALKLIIKHVAKHGIPKSDCIVISKIEKNIIEQWTFKGLSKLLIAK